MIEFREEQKEELQALEAIYSDELKGYFLLI
jgi:RWD domain